MVDTGVYAAAQKLVTQLDGELHSTRAGAVCCAFVHPGTMTPDYGACTCEDDSGATVGEGMAWARVVSIAPTVAGRFPQTVTVPVTGGQTVQLAAVIELGVIRCSWGTEDNSMPHGAYLDSMARDALDDAAAMQRAAQAADLGTWVMGIWVPRGPSGGVHGGTMTVTVLVDTCARGETMPPLDTRWPMLPDDPRGPSAG